MAAGVRQDHHWYRADRSFWQPSPCLVPTVTIREQWVDRIQTAFENEQKDFRSRFPKLKGDEGINDCDISGFS